ncbi:MAG: hypothetical protein RLZZ618_932 [Pseudomonadota bacterium]|jgi:AraC-like DNA-binding protein
MRSTTNSSHKPFQGTYCHPTLIVGYARILQNHLRIHRVNLRDVLSAEDLLLMEQADPFARFPLERWEAAMARAEHLLNDPYLALRLAEQIKPWSLGLLGFLMVTCRVLREVGAVVVRFENPVNALSGVWLEETPTTFVMRLKKSAFGGSQRLKLLSIGSWAWQSRWLTGRSDLVFDASFDTPEPADLSLYHTTFGRSLKFDAPNCWMAGAKDYLHLPVLQADTGIHGLLREQALEKLKLLVDTGDTLLGRVEHLIKSGMPDTDISLGEVAVKIGISPRTLQSRLNSYGVNFRHLVDGVRRTQAEHYLRDGELTLIQIAEVLGFSTQASFQHAFKRWTGCTPGEYRRQHGS